jgi:hypothetical protein
VSCSVRPSAQNLRRVLQPTGLGQPSRSALTKKLIAPGATAAGCVGHSLLATGLAYGAFQSGDGPIEIVGIVPDEVTAIEIDGITVKPTNNVWHYTATEGVALKITVRSADDRTAATV